MRRWIHPGLATTTATAALVGILAAAPMAHAGHSEDPGDGKHAGDGINVFPLASLPSDVLGCVLGQLTKIDDLRNAKYVCQEWNKAAKLPWKNLQATIPRVHTQDELNAALTNPEVTALVVVPDSKVKIDHLNVNSRLTYIAIYDSLFTGWDTREVWVNGKLHVHVYGHAAVKAWESAKISAWGNSSILAFDKATVIAHDDTQISAYGKVEVTAHDKADISLNGDATATAYDQTRVHSVTCGAVTAYGKAEVTSYGAHFTVITAHDDATIKASPGTTIILHDNATVSYREPDEPPVSECAGNTNPQPVKKKRKGIPMPKCVIS